MSQFLLMLHEHQCIAKSACGLLCNMRVTCNKPTAIDAHIATTDQCIHKTIPTCHETNTPDPIKAFKSLCQPLTPQASIDIHYPYS